MNQTRPEPRSNLNTGAAPGADDAGNVQGRLVAQEVTTQSRSNFFWAFRVLPKARRQAIYAVYAYCRLIDDIVDSDAPLQDKQQALSRWESELYAAFGGHPVRHPIAAALQAAHARFGISQKDALLVLRGCQMDLHKRRYATWDELHDYCYHVASAVGLMCIALFGCKMPGSATYAVHLGRALQLTNILRDVAEDAARDRIYLPTEALREFGLVEDDVLQARRGPKMLWLLRHVAARARSEFACARALLPPQDRRALWPAEIMGHIYFAILEQVEARGDDVVVPGFRAQLGKLHKGRCLLAATWSSV